MLDPARDCTRRHFLATAAISGAALLSPAYNGAAEDVRQTSNNPYQNLDWPSVRQIGSGTHIHCRSQRAFDILYRRGLRHLAISNYYPSVPCSADELSGQYQVEQSFATLQGEGYVRRTFRWNDILTNPETGWSRDLPQELQETFPFKTGGRIFAEMPADVIICPNAEHHSLTDSRGHFNSVGSKFSSGTFDVRNKYQLGQHGYLLGVSLPWKTAFSRVFDELQFADGGGITINHPIWSSLKLETMLEYLDFDPRVLGMEIWNHTCEQINGKGWALDRWDEILKTGRRCYGFAVSDHVHSNDPTFQGYNVLLVDHNTSVADLPAACLRAYRQGQFYCTLLGEIRFENIRSQGPTLSVTTNQPCVLRAITATGVVAEREGTGLEWSRPTDTTELMQHRYVRFEAKQVSGKDRIFSQPISL